MTQKQKSSRMFTFITETCNFLGGECPYGCVYCWANALKKRYNFKKYMGKPFVIEKELKRNFKNGSFVFACDMTDLLAENVPDACIEKILAYVKTQKCFFLLETKNPARYLDFLEQMPSNVYLGATIESNRNCPEISKAPSQHNRIKAMVILSFMQKNPLFISIEPILDFDLNVFVQIIKQIKPWAVAVGYDNYNHKLPEPALAKTMQLIEALEKFTIVYRKTLRRAWWE